MMAGDRSSSHHVDFRMLLYADGHVEQVKEDGSEHARAALVVGFAG